MSELADRVERLTGMFTRCTGTAPSGVWAAHGRVNLIGEHTDYNHGYVLPFAIDRSVLAAASRRDDGVLRLWSLQQPEPVQVPLTAVLPRRVDGWAAYPAGSAWSLIQAGVRVRGADIVLDGDVPEGSGLSSSAAVESVATLALAELYGARLEPVEVALIAHRAEVDIVGVPCGVMDQMASVLGRSGHALFLDTRTLHYEHVPFHPDADGLTLVVIDTKAPRKLVEGRYAERRASCERASRTLGVPALRDADLLQVDAAAALLGAEHHRRARHVVTENGRVLQAVDQLRRRDWEGLGPLMTASHESLRDDFAVSSPELDTAVAAALSAGALGARMTGAGFGGCAIALVPTGGVAALQDRVQSMFAGRRFNQPAVLTVSATDGARRIQ